MINWDNIDWRQSNQEIAQELAWDTRAIALKRSYIVDRKKSKISEDTELLIDFNRDWKLSDKELSTKYSVTVNIIKFYRKERLIKSISNNHDWKSSDLKLSEKYNRAVSTIKAFRKKVIGSYITDLGEWYLSNEELAREYHLTTRVLNSFRRSYSPETWMRSDLIKRISDQEDWGLTDEALAIKYERAVSTINAYRRSLKSHLSVSSFEY